MFLIPQALLVQLPYVYIYIYVFYVLGFFKYWQDYFGLNV